MRTMAMKGYSVFHKAPEALLRSTSNPQMIYKIKRASNDSQKTMKETKAR